MAGVYYSLDEVVAKLGKTADEIKNMVKQGKLHEYRDGAKIVFKITEIDAIVAKNAKMDITGSEIELVLDETGEISLDSNIPGIPPTDRASGGFGLSSAGDITAADTNVGTTGINVLGETDDEYKLTEDTKAETKVFGDDGLGELGDLDADSNLESVGSGSGLLDLSLQADDTSLGAVLDDILPAAVDGAPEGLALEDDMSDEADKIFDHDSDVMPAAAGPEPIRETTVSSGVARAPQVRAAVSESPAFGIALVLPLVAVIYAAIVTSAAMKGVCPGIVQVVQKTQFYGLGLIWYIVIVFCLLTAIFGISGFMSGSKSGGVKQAKPKKVKKRK
jgi:hypothetical protein